MDLALGHLGTARVAASADKDVLQALINGAFQIEQGMKRGSGERLDPNGNELGELLARGTFLIAEQPDGNTPAACIYLEPREGQCYLGLLSVAPAFQGRGLARELMRLAENFAREHACGSLFLHVVSPRREELVPLYERFGFAETGRREYPPALTEIMVEPGYFIVMTKQL